VELRHPAATAARHGFHDRLCGQQEHSYSQQHFELQFSRSFSRHELSAATSLRKVLRPGRSGKGNPGFGQHPIF
jgi:hypothetical protein